MRRDVFRVGLGRLAFELAIGVTLLLAAGDGERTISLALAALGGTFVYVTRQRWATNRRTFFAAHLTLGTAALVALVGPRAPWLGVPALALALGAAIELCHLDLMLRRRIHEAIDTVRWPRSVILRRIGTVIIASAGARAMVSIEANAELASHLAVVVLLIAVGATFALSAGFAAGPGRPHTRPLDAILFLGFATVCALCPLGR
jgi:hypothetical protein